MSSESAGAGLSAATTESALRLVWLYPDLMSTYGDRGNLLILAYRARARGFTVQTGEVRSGDAIPAHADIYLIGGGEDGPQALAAERLIADGALRRAVERGSVVFAVCAGYQVMGESFYARDEKCAGAGLLDVRSDRGRTRAVGELAGAVDPLLALPTLTGFENHGGRTHPGPDARPMARVTTGTGNDGQTEGAYRGTVLGTYCHGPALARNPALADLLLRWATGVDDLAPLDESWTGRLRDARFTALQSG